DMQAGRRNLVLTEIEARLARTPDEADLLMVAAKIYTAARMNDRAEQTLRHILDVAPMTLQAYSMLARQYVQQSRLGEARAELDSVARQFPRSTGAQTLAAMTLEMEGKFDEAEQRYTAILASNPRAAVAANNLAWRIAEKDGNLDTALQLAQTS